MQYMYILIEHSVKYSQEAVHEILVLITYKE